jgi:hypothetical protein
MNFDLLDRDLSTVLAEGRVVAAEADCTFGRLSARQVNWKPSEADWSIGQCFDHLAISNRAYVPIIEAILQGRGRTTVWQRMPLLPRFFGRLIIKILHPESPRTAKARKRFLPSSSAIDPGIIGTFLEQHGRVMTLMERTSGLDLDRITITSPVLAVMTYSLMDAYRIIVVHEQNHFVQARRVLESTGFPVA